MSPLEAVLQWYLFASVQLHWDYNTIDSILLDEFLTIIVLYDKVQHPKDYMPAENLFRQFM